MVYEGAHVGVRRDDGFDVLVAAAWQRFESNLATHVAAMPEGTYITITAAQATHGQRGQRPYVDLVAIDTEQLVGVASLPSYLYPDSADAAEADRRLHGLGWSEAGRPALDGTVMDFTVDAPRDEADLLATISVATFREVWHVPHPSFLSAWTVGRAGAGGPVALAHDPVTSASTASVPIQLRSLHTFCELLGAPVDTATVLSVCEAEDLPSLRRCARDQAALCSVRARDIARSSTPGSARMWVQLARAWHHTADSVHNALTATSGQDRPAKSAGS